MMQVHSDDAIVLHEAYLRQAENALLQIAGDADEAKRLVEYLATVDWHEIVLDRQQERIADEQEKQRHIQEMIAKGGGYCDGCSTLVEDVFPFPWMPARYSGKYCIRCINGFQKDYGISSTERLHYCDECQKVFPFKELIQHDRIKTKWSGYCASCLGQLIERESIICAVCGKKTLEYTFHSQMHSTCSQCYVRSPARAAVLYHNSRAKAVGLPATLTEQQWVQVMTHFDNTCAYCGKKPYEVLEHFLPLAKQGGTAAGNCVPACQGCNQRKGDKHPDDFATLFSAKNITRIRAYFESVASFTETRACAIEGNTHHELL